MDSINHILTRREVNEPPEFSRIKKYLKDKYDYDCMLTIKGKSLVIGVSNSSLLSTLRYDLPNLKRELSITQDITLRRIV
jgi:hypothetical protein